MTTTAPAISSPLDWAHAFERYIHAPQTQSNDAILVGWAAAEGGHWHNSAWFNPLNTTIHEPGSHVMGGGGGGAAAGVQAYSSWTEGLKATYDSLNGWLQQGGPKILADLRAGAPAATTAHDIGASSWLQSGGSPSYGQKVGSLAGVAYNPTNPSPPNGSPAQEAGLSVPNPLDLIPNPVSGVLGPLIDFVKSTAVRATLVVGGTVAIIVGAAGLFDHESSSAPAGTAGGSSGGASSGPGPRAPRAAHKRKGGVGADVKETAEGAGEAL